MRVAALLLVLLSVSGCATMKNTFTWSTWDHFAFSAKANWQIFHYWNATATRRDAETARAQGGWWGDEVPVEDK
jgi:hypothetical protein